jgi:hypothetical protein
MLNPEMCRSGPVQAEPSRPRGFGEMLDRDRPRTEEKFFGPDRPRFVGPGEFWDRLDFLGPTHWTEDRPDWTERTEAYI